VRAKAGEYPARTLILFEIALAFEDSTFVRISGRNRNFLLVAPEKNRGSRILKDRERYHRESSFKSDRGMLVRNKSSRIKFCILISAVIIPRFFRILISTSKVGNAIAMQITFLANGFDIDIEMLPSRFFPSNVFRKIYPHRIWRIRLNGNSNKTRNLAESFKLWINDINWISGKFNWEFIYSFPTLILSYKLKISLFRENLKIYKYYKYIMWRSFIYTYPLKEIKFYFKQKLC